MTFNITEIRAALDAQPTANDLEEGRQAWGRHGIHRCYVEVLGVHHDIRSREPSPTRAQDTAARKAVAKAVSAGKGICNPRGRILRVYVGLDNAMDGRPAAKAIAIVRALNAIGIGAWVEADGN